MQAARQVKGILNKLTPENFDRLLQQVLDIVTDAEILHSTITLVFENAVAQPTFAFMYAQLCDRLSKVRGRLSSYFPQINPKKEEEKNVHLLLPPRKAPSMHGRTCQVLWAFTIKNTIVHTITVAPA